MIESKQVQKVQPDSVSERDFDRETIYVTDEVLQTSTNLQDIKTRIVNKNNNALKIIIVVLLVILGSIILYLAYNWLEYIQISDNEKQIDNNTLTQIEKQQSQMIKGSDTRTIVKANHSTQQNKIIKIGVNSSITQINNQNINPGRKVRFELNQSQNYQINMKSPQIQGSKPRQLGTVSVVKFLKKDSKNRMIDQFLYKNPQLRSARTAFHHQRIYLLKQYQTFESIFLAQYNNRVDSQNLQEENVKLNLQYQRVKKLHNLQEYKDQLPMCIISPSYRNNNKFRIEYNLNSIFTQNYSNYYAVIINDASDDNSDYVFRRYFQFYNISSEKYIYINNNQQKGAMENFYIANHNYCSKDAIAVNLDGDDEFIGKNVLKVFNVEYQRKKAGAIYSNFYSYENDNFVAPGFSRQFQNHIKQSNDYRYQGWQSSHLKTYRTQLFRKVPKQDFQDKNGKFYMFTSDLAIYFPLMQLSCKRVYQIKGYHYLYNRGTGNNEDYIDRGKQMAIQRQIREKPRHTCDEEFKKKMENST